jgi:hypothetical protein
VTLYPTQPAPLLPLSFQVTGKGKPAAAKISPPPAHEVRGATAAQAAAPEARCLQLSPADTKASWGEGENGRGEISPAPGWRRTPAATGWPGRPLRTDSPAAGTPPPTPAPHAPPTVSRSDVRLTQHLDSFGSRLGPERALLTGPLAHLATSPVVLTLDVPRYVLDAAQGRGGGPCVLSIRATAMQKLRIVRLGFGT